MLDLCDGSRDVLDRLQHVNPKAITNVSLEFNLMAELVFDQEWMQILEAIGSLPYIQQVSLSFRVPLQIPMEAFIEFIELASSLETLNLIGLQLSSNRFIQTASQYSSDSEDDEEEPVDALIRAFQHHLCLKNVHLCRYRPVKSISTNTAAAAAAAAAGSEATGVTDPLLRALCKTPRLQVFHVERTDIFSDPAVLQLVCGAPFPKIKIGTLERTVPLEHYLPRMGEYLADNSHLKELEVHHLLQDTALTAVAQMLRNNTSLLTVSLRIQSNEFGRILDIALGENCALRNLELNIVSRDRTVFRRQVGLLAQSLGANHQSALTTLTLASKSVRSSNMLTDPFLKMLREDNFMLQNLVINRNTVPLSPELLFYLKLNQLGRNHFLGRDETEDGAPRRERGLLGSPQDFRIEWVCMLIENKHDVRVLHYFLSRNPLILPTS